ncbi:hypothetical protein [Clostridium estertheticum]|uniref:Uncharacterized protein n=1 Tax=Clostridium estertheticum TaxID=238834 RepID=A0AA47EJV3_9CLOT|nr:hypothetical protein [Clostridium estertheticum]MBU3155187.1 hypothetical protein [Clostridium estertheticum]WAG61241.1 hypothetical protein LL038_03035 [Clostridium estertheticum]
MANINFREPVEYIIKRYDKKRNTKITVEDDANKSKVELPEYPCRLVRNEAKKVISVLYAEGTESEWSEALIRDVNGKVFQIKTTYPDKSSKTVELFKDMDNRVEKIKYV